MKRFVLADVGDKDLEIQIPVCVCCFSSVHVAVRIKHSSLSIFQDQILTSWGNGNWVRLLDYD